MDYNFVNENNSSSLTNEIDYNQVQGNFPGTYNDSSSYNEYPTSTTSKNNEINDFNNSSYQNDYTTQPYADSSNIYEKVNDINDGDFATVVKIYDENEQKAETYQNEISNNPSNEFEYNFNTSDNIINSNNITETAEYQTSYQQNEFTDTTANIESNNIINDNITEYQATSTPINYNTNSDSLSYDYNINTAPVDYNISTNEVTNNYNNNYYETNTDIGTGNDNYYTAKSVQNNYVTENRNSFPDFNAQYNSLNYSDNNNNDNNNNNLSMYNTNSVPINTTPQFNEDDDTEIIPVEEIEYIPKKRIKYIRRKKAKVVQEKKTVIIPKKKTVIIPKKVIVPIPVKKKVYIQKEVKPKVLPSLTKVTKVPSVINQQQFYSTVPTRKKLVNNSIVPGYKPKIYRIKL